MHNNCLCGHQHPSVLPHPTTTTTAPLTHQVRNLIEHAGLEVKTLRRVRIGGYRLPSDLPFGQFKELKPNEVRRVLDQGADRNA